MKRFFKPLIVGIVIISILSGSALYLISKNEALASYVGTLSNVVSILSAILLFGVSLLAYQKFNASQQTTDKKAEKVFELIQCLQEIRLTAIYTVSPGRSNSVFDIRPVSDKKVEKPINKMIFRDKSKENNPHYFDESVTNVYQDLVTLSEDIFMPKNIAEKIRSSFDIEGMFSINTKPYKDVNNYELVIYARRTRNSNLSLYSNLIEDPVVTPQKVITDFNSKPVDANKLIKDIRSINKLAHKWIKENSPYVISDLNV